MADDEQVKAEIAKVQDAIIDNFAKQGITPDAVVTLTGRELGKYMSDMTVRMSVSVGKQVLTQMQKMMLEQQEVIKEYMLNEIAPDLVPDFEKVGTIAREVARIDRELKATKMLVEAINERLDNGSR